MQMQMQMQIYRRVRLVYMKDEVNGEIQIQSQKKLILKSKLKEQIPNRHVVTEIPRTEEAASALEKVTNANVSF